MKYIYNVPIQEVAQTDETDRLATALAESGILGTDNANVEALAQQAGEIQLSGQIRAGMYSGLIADELEELADSALSELPLYRRDGDYSGAGYYEVESADVSPAHPTAPSVYEFTLGVTKVGTKARHFRAIETNRRQADHEFGNDLEATVSAPSEARKVQWYGGVGNRAVANSVGTVATEYGEAVLYDLDNGEAAVGDEPMLIYEIDYADEVAAGARVYDTLGETDKFDENGTRQWQAVYLTDHDIDHPIVLDTGRLRVSLDDSAGTLEAEEWDGTAGAWSAITLSQPTAVDLYDADLETVAMVRDRAQLTFDVDGSLFSLNATVHRGDDAVLWDIPPNEEGPIPDSLESWLSPIASSSIVDPQGAKTLVSRGEVRR